MKKFGSTILVITFIASFLLYFAWRDYSWADRVKSEVSGSGLKLVYEQDNHGSLERPWTWIKTPVTSLWYVDLEGMGQISDEIAVVRTVRISYNFGKPETTTSYELVDRSTGRSHILRSTPLTVDDLPKERFEDLKWHKYADDTPGIAIVDFVIANFSNIPKLRTP